MWSSRRCRAVRASADLLRAINEAADELDIEDEENFDRGGRPSVYALSKALGYPITREERDAAMSAVARAPQATRVTSASEVKAAVEARTAEGRSTVTLPKRAKAADEPAEQRVPV